MIALKSKTALVATAAAFLTCASQTHATDIVTLVDRVGGSSITGELIDYSDDTYWVKTVIGKMTFQRSAVSCQGDACPIGSLGSDAFTIVGASTLTSRLVPALLETFALRNAYSMRSESEDGSEYVLLPKGAPAQIVHVKNAYSAMGFADLFNGEADFALTSRIPNAEELAAAEAAGFGPVQRAGVETLIGYDALIVGLHPSNPINAFETSTLADILSGKVSDWADLGRSDPGKITIYVREEGSTSRRLLDHVIMRPSRAQLMADVQVLPSDEAIAEAIKSDPNGIGLKRFGNRSDTNSAMIQGPCGIRVDATPFTIKSGEYPLAHPIYLYAKEGAAEEAVDFLRFVTSEAAGAVIENAGFISTGISERMMETQGLRVANSVLLSAEEDLSGTKQLIRQLKDAKRLSTTVRYTGGSKDLDNVGYQELERLAKLMRTNEHKGKTFYFIGFTDSVGRKDLNLFLAVQRAELVRQALISRYPDLAKRVRAEALAYGELSPLACNETRAGREMNRRVEVWVHDDMVRLAGN